MNLFNTVVAPESWINNFHIIGQEPRQIDQIRSFTDIFLVHFVSDKFATQNKEKRLFVTGIYKEVLETVRRFTQKAAANGELEVSIELTDRIVNVNDFIDCVRLTDDLFFDVLREDVGNDLDPEGYLVYDLVVAKGMLFDLFEAIFHYVVKSTFEYAHRTIEAGSQA